MKEATQQNKDQFEPLVALCQRVSPFLKGCLYSPDLTPTNNTDDHQLLVGDFRDLAVIQSLYSDIQAEHPEAGHGYWLTRTCESLFWQPIYISMIAIYGLQTLPSFDGFAQEKHKTYIMGFRYPASTFTLSESANSTSVAKLIHRAGEQLTQLFEHYRAVIDSWLRCRPGFVQQIVADLILATIQKIPQLNPMFDQSQQQKHARWWLTACQLPLNNLLSYSIADDGSLQFVRRSCCLVYKTEQGELCANCPRHKHHRKREKQCIN